MQTSKIDRTNDGQTDGPTLSYHDQSWETALGAARRAQRRVPLDTGTERTDSIGPTLPEIAYCVDFITDILESLSLSKSSSLLRTVELGSGRLDLCRSIVDMLPRNRVNYQYSIAQEESQGIRDQVTSQSSIEVVPFDLGHAAAETGLHAACADVVVSLNPSGWNGDTQAAMVEAFRILAPGGLLCFTFLGDEETSQDQENNSPGNWTNALQEVGFERVVLYLDAGSSKKMTLSQVVLAQKAGRDQAFSQPVPTIATIRSPLAATMDQEIVNALAGAVIDRLYQEPGIARMLTGDFANLTSSTAVARKPTLKFKPSLDELGPAFGFTGMQAAYWIGREKHFELGGVTPHWFVELDVPFLDIAAVNVAIQLLIERHPMLRAVILDNDDQRVLQRTPDYEIDVVDLRDLDEGEAQRRILAARKRMATVSPDIRAWPLFEFIVHIVNNESMKIFFNISIFIVDGSSLEVLFREFMENYDNPDFQRPAIGYSVSDYVKALPGAVSDEKLQRAKNYWWPRIPDLPPAPALPIMSNLDFEQRPKFSRRVSEMDRASWTRLKTRAAEHQLTVPAVCCATFAAVLATWSRRKHFCLSVMFGSRLPLDADVPHIVGNFSTTSILEVDGRGQLSFEDFAKSLRDRLLLDMDHGQLSGVDVLRKINRLQGGTTRAAMPVVFNMYGPSGPSDVFPTTWPSAVAESGVETPQVYLENQVIEAAGSAILAFDSLDDVFDEGVIEAMFDAYLQLLHRLVDDGAVWSMPVRVVPESQLAARKNVNATDGPVPEGLLHAGFFDLATQHPERPAVITSDQRLSYGEVADQAARVATWLMEQGAKPSVLIPVVMEKGWQQVIGVMGTLRAGAAYMPVDASVPRERLTYLLEQCEIRVALTQARYTDSLDWPKDVKVLAIDGPDLANIEPCTEVRPQSAKDLAYVIFTSGTTGLPKGVMIDHRGALNTIVDVNETFNVGPDDRTFGLSALHFDLSVYDIFGPLIVGGAVVLPDADKQMDPEHWIELIVKELVTVWNSVPALMQLLIDSSSSRASGLKETVQDVLLSGDWIPINLPDKIKRLFGGDIRVSSLGGATEASIWSIIYPIERVDPDQPSIPYGKPMRNQSFHVLDDDLNHQPDLVTGELYIGGIGVAKGYWNDQERTGAAFIMHPQTGEPLYRTGDMGRYLLDGNIEFLGREDTQVKIHGYRIELGEIETTLSQTPGVYSSVIVAAGDGKIKNRLRGFVVPSLMVNRVAISRPCTLVLDDGTEVSAETVDLSETEVHLRLADTLATSGEQKGTLKIEIQAGDGPAELIGRLRGSNERDTVLTFDGENKPAIGTLKSFIRDYALRDMSSVADILQYYFTDRRRQHFRAPIDVPCRVRFGEQEAIECMIKNGSHVGARISGIDYQAEAGTEVRVSFTLPNQHALLRTSARVVWHDGLGMGIVFKQSDDELRKEFDAVALHSAFDILIRSEGYLLTKATIPTLVQRISERLPSYMVPTEWVLLDALPITANGKIDRKKLSEWRVEEVTGEGRGVAPSTQLERQLVQLWSGLLQVPGIGVTDDFFELGGDSLLAVGMMTAIRELVGHEVPISTLFQSPTIRLMAASLTEQKGEEGYSSLIPINPIGTTAPLFLVHPVGGTVICYSDMARELGREQRLYGLEAQGLDGRNEPSGTIGEMAEAYLRAIREIQPEGPYLIGGWSMGAIVAYEMARLIELEGDRVRMLFLIDCVTPTVSEGPDDASMLHLFLRDLAQQNTAANKLELEALQEVEPNDRVELAWNLARDAKLIPQEMVLSQFENFANVYCANIRAVWDYEPGEHAAPTIAFHATEGIESMTWQNLARFGWEDRIEVKVNHVDLACDHYSIMQGEPVRTISRHIVDSIY